MFVLVLLFEIRLYEGKAAEFNASGVFAFYQMILIILSILLLVMYVW
jgi:hypothetical protein